MIYIYSCLYLWLVKGMRSSELPHLPQSRALAIGVLFLLLELSAFSCRRRGLKSSSHVLNHNTGILPVHCS